MKTENLTFLEAVEAMKRGECVHHGPYGWIYRINGSALELWDFEWREASCLTTDARYRIVPDPSKPAQKESERAWGKYKEAMQDFGYDEERVSRQLVLDKLLANAVLAQMREEQGK